jgi:hypothetical protein
MRKPILIMCGVLSLPLLGLGQQNPTRSPKVLTPEQQAHQQQMREIDAERQRLRARAKQAFDAEMERERTGDCPAAKGTYEFNVCYAKEIGITEGNLKTYEGAIRDLLGLKYPKLTDQPPIPGPAGSQSTPEQRTVEFDHLVQLWRSYLDTASTAAFHQFQGGTGGPSFEMETHLLLVRSHMRELDKIYDMLLHL